MRVLLGAPLVAVLAAAMPAEAHPIYIGRVRAALSDTALSGRLSVNRLDFLQALEAELGDGLFGLPRHQLDHLSCRYLQGHLRAVVDGDTLALAIERAGQERDEVWFDFAFPAPAAPRLLTLEVTVLFELFPEQRNLLELTTPRGLKRHVFAPARPVLVQEVAPP